MPEIWVYALATLLPFLTVEVRRLHDIGRPGWWWLFGLIPVLGQIVLVVFCATDGIAGDNRYGPDPKARDPRLAPQPGVTRNDA